MLNKKVENKELNISDLISIFKSKYKTPEENILNYKYVIYLRKSTDEEGKQDRSIDDQKSECLEFAKKNNLTVVDIVEEKCSAKESDKRPKFREMMKKLNSGVYNSVLSWHPDRLSRNMKEAGEIIDLIDKNIIEDLKFVAFTFNNDPSGKLLLGITFAMSKEYSDKLSLTTNRGNKGLIDKGFAPKKNKGKKGYYVDANRYLRPDGENFSIMENAFKMKIVGETYENIALYLNKNRKSASENSVSKKELPNFIKQNVAKFLKDPVYAGVLAHGKNMQDLSEVYDFKSMLTAAEYIQINKRFLNDVQLKKLRGFRSGIRAKLLNGCVFCGECESPMSSGIAKKIYFYYRCEKVACEIKTRQVRAKVVIDYVCEYIENNFIYSDEVYKHYKKETKEQYKFLQKNEEIEYSRLISRKVKLKSFIDNIKERILSDNNKDDVALIISFKNDFEKYEVELSEVDVLIVKHLEIRKEKLKILDQEEFLELLKKLPNYIRNMKEMDKLDFVIKKMFLNFTILGGKVVKSTLNSPFDVLFDKKVPTGADGETRTLMGCPERF